MTAVSASSTLRLHHYLCHNPIVLNKIDQLTVTASWLSANWLSAIWSSAKWHGSKLKPLYEAIPRSLKKLSQTGTKPNGRKKSLTTLFEINWSDKLEQIFFALEAKRQLEPSFSKIKNDVKKPKKYPEGIRRSISKQPNLYGPIII